MITHKSVSLADQIFETLEEDILTGKYPRGEILTEVGLSEALGVSRTPVREALRRLEQEHIIEDCGKGMQVLGITAEDARYIYEVRKCIEGMAASACALHATDEQVKELQELVDLQGFYAGREDSENIKLLDSEFHRKIYRYSGSAVLYDTLVPLHKKIQKYRKISVENKGRAVESVKEHREIVERIAARDPEGAEKVMYEHICRAQKSLEGLDTLNG